MATSDPHPYLFVIAPTGSPIVNESRQTSRSLHLQWKPPSPEEQNGIITRYTLQVVYQETGEISENQTLPVSWSVVEGLHPHTIYMYRIAAHTVAGQGPFTPDYSITTLEEGKLTIFMQWVQYSHVAWCPL